MALCPVAASFLPPLPASRPSGSRSRWWCSRFPRDRCGQPQADALDAARGLAWRDIGVRKIKQQVTAAELAAHCGPAFKDLIHIDDQFGTDLSRGGPVFRFHHPDVLHACIYREGRDPEVGQFVRGVPLDAAQSRRLRSALTGAGVPASGCSPQSRFAVISVSGDYVVVELGGCWRVQRDEAHVTLGTADPSVLRRLLGVH